MLIEKDTIKAESHFNDERTHRYLCKRTWNKDKPSLAVIALNANFSDNIINDTTTGLIINNVARLESYGSVHILNLYSVLTNKLNFRYNSDDDLNHKENDAQILKSAEECDKVVLCWGMAQNTNLRIAERARQVIKLLEPYKDKLYCLSDGNKKFYHPLTPSIRTYWEIEKISLEELNKLTENKNVPT